MSRSSAPSSPRIADEARAEPVGLLELALQRAARRARSARAGRRWRASLASRKARPRWPLVGVGHEEVHRRRRRPAAAPAASRMRSTPAAHPQPGVGGAAELLDQPVVAAAAADAALGAQRARLELEHRARVVVQAAHERGVDLVGHVGGVEQRAHGREVLEVVVGRGGRAGAARSAMTSRVPGWSVSKARSGLRSMRSRTSRARLVLVGAQVGLQLLAVGGARLRACRGWRSAARTPRDAERVEQLGQQHDELGVHGRVVRADRLRADLPELAVAARLRRLVAVERSTGTRASRAGAACACRARRRRGRPAPCPPGAGSASARPRRRRCTSPSARCPWTPPRRARTARSPRRSASRCAGSRPPPARCAPRAPPRSRACRVLGQHVERAARRLDAFAGSLRGGELGEERVRGALAAERRDAHVPGVDRRLVREGVEQRRRSRRQSVGAVAARAGRCARSSPGRARRPRTALLAGDRVGHVAGAVAGGEDARRCRSRRARGARRPSTVWSAS